MRAQVRSSLLWGTVGALSFLVLAQGYELAVGDLGVGFAAKVGLAVVVGAVAAGASFVLEPRLERRRSE